MQMQSSRMIHIFANLSPKGGIREGGAGVLPKPESEGWALVPELSFLNSENPSDSFNPLEPCWPYYPSM